MAETNTETDALRAEVAHWKAHAEEAGLGFSEVCKNYARVAARNVVLVERLQAALYRVDVAHQFHGSECLCGFRSDRARSRTEHITTAVAELLNPSASSSPEEGQ